VEWSRLAEAAPEKLVLIPCGFSMDRTERELGALTSRPEWPRLPAVRTGEVYLADGPAFFNGAGPRLVDGLEILAEILHPEAFPRRHRRGWRRLRNLGLRVRRTHA
jgi:iron complex transport system substrate-binding protein